MNIYALNIKRIFITGVLLVAGFSLVAWGVNYLRYGKLTVTASSETAEIYLIEELGAEPKRVGTKTAAVRLKPGRYELQVKDGGAETRFAATVERAKTANADIELVQPKNAEIVIPQSAQNMTLSGSRLRFLDPNLNLVYETSTSPSEVGQPQELFTDAPQFTQVDWLGFAKGVALSKSGDPYLLEGSSANRLELAGLADTSNPSLIGKPFAVNASGQLAIIDGGSLFFYPGIGVQPTKVADGLKQDAQLFLSNDGKILYAEQPPLESDFEYPDDEQVRVTEESVRVTVFDGTTAQTLNERTVSENKDFIISAWWSPDNKEFVYASPIGLYAHNVDSTSSRPLLASFGEITSVYWLSDATLAVTNGQAVWRIDTGRATAQKLSKDAGHTDYADSLVTDGNYFYFGTRDRNKFATGTVFRIPR